jgi:hypothetical protein
MGWGIRYKRSDQKLAEARQAIPKARPGTSGFRFSSMTRPSHFQDLGTALDATEEKKEWSPHP